jgi:hypothetical protein
MLLSLIIRVGYVLAGITILHLQLLLRRRKIASRPIATVCTRSSVVDIALRAAGEALLLAAIDSVSTVDRNLARSIVGRRSWITAHTVKQFVED